MADLEFRIDSDSPANDDLKFWRIVGHEGLARPSSYELTVLSAREDISASDILGRAFDVVIEFFDADEGKHERHAKGHAVRFTRMAQIGRYFEYRISLRSWFWLLTKRINSRILQDKPVLEVLDAVFENSPITSLKKTNTDGVRGTHDPRRYCVQYQESDFNFLSRILEDEGIYYWFDAHDAPGTMRMADASDMAHTALPADGVLRFMPKGAGEARFNEIEQWVDARQFQSGKYASHDVDYKAIGKLLNPVADVPEGHELDSLEVFEYHGGYFNKPQMDAVIERRADEMMARRQLHWAITHWPDVTAGRSFTLEGDPDGTRNGDYLIGGCIFAVTHPGYEGLGQEGAAQPVEEVLREAIAADAVNVDCLPPLVEMIRTTASLRSATRGTGTFLLTALPAKTSFRPPRLTPRVTMPGPQSAIVVGGKGKEHDVDDMGRVMVHFHWDRYDKRDDKSTCRIRVSQPWAGKGWGGYFAPRIHQEVIVDFMNGDPDRPIIVGRVYNDDQPIPYKSATQSGFKTRSTPGGGPANYNEIMFEDQKGEENINIHAEKNMSRSVENDDSTSVGNDQSETVDRDRNAHVKRHEKQIVDKNQTNIVGVKQSNTIGSGGQITQVVGPQENIFMATQKTSVTGRQSIIVGAGQKVDITGLQKITVAGSQETGIHDNQKTTVLGKAELFAGGNVKIQSGSDHNDVTGGTHAIMATAVKVISSSKLEMMAVGDINATSVGSNTTVLGANSSGYIGMNSEANLGMARSTFMGLSLNNALAVDISNFAGVQIENTAAAHLSNVAGLNLGTNAVDFELQGLKMITGGGGAGAGAAGGVASGVIGGALGLAGLAAGGYDIYKTFEQYENAMTQMKEAAELAEANDMTELGSRLRRMRDTARIRYREGIVGLPGALIEPGKESATELGEAEVDVDVLPVVVPNAAVPAEPPALPPEMPPQPAPDASE